MSSLDSEERGCCRCVHGLEGKLSKVSRSQVYMCGCSVIRVDVIMSCAWALRLGLRTLYRQLSGGAKLASNTILVIQKESEHLIVSQDGLE